MFNNPRPTERRILRIENRRFDLQTDYAGCSHAHRSIQGIASRVAHEYAHDLRLMECL